MSSDVFTPERRSAVMSLIRGKGNKATELRMIALFRAYSVIGWRRDVPLFGKPDFVFRRKRVAVFVDGCFWHRCPKPKHSPIPKNRAEWWAEKFRRNEMRDRLVNRKLRSEGWRVIRIWECDLADQKNWKRIYRRFARSMESNMSTQQSCSGDNVKL